MVSPGIRLGAIDGWGATVAGEAPVVRGLGKLGSNLRGGQGEQAGCPAVGFGAIAGVLEPAGEAG